MSEIETKYFVKSFIRFLHKQIDECNFSSDIIESLEVASQCLETAYNIEANDDSAGVSGENNSSNNAADGTSAGGAGNTEDMNPMSHIDVYELFQNACSSDPERKKEAEVIKNLGNGLMREEKYHEALKAYNKAISLDPTNAVFYCNRAATWCRLGEYQRAIDDCKLSLRYDGNYSKAHGRMGIAYTKLNKDDLAAKAYRSALELEPNNADYLNNLNVVQQRLDAGVGNQTQQQQQQQQQPPIPGVGAAGINAAAFQIPGGNNLMESVGAMLNNPSIRDSIRQMASDPGLQGLIQSMTLPGGGAGNVSPDMFAQFTQQFSSHLQNNPGNILGNLMEQFGQHPPSSDGGNDTDSNQQPPPQPPSSEQP